MKLCFWKKHKPQEDMPITPIPIPIYEPDLTTHKELVDLPALWPGEIIFAFCLSCGQDYLCWPGKCADCGSEENAYMGTVQGTIWRGRKFPGNHNFKSVSPLSHGSVKNCHRYKEIMCYINPPVEIKSLLAAMKRAIECWEQRDLQNIKQNEWYDIIDHIIRGEGSE